MTAFLAIWPDSSISVVSYPSGHEDETYEAWLWDDLDAEADPSDARVYRLPPGHHVQTDVYLAEHKQSKQPKAMLAVTSCHLDCKRARKFPWSPDACFKHFNRRRMEMRKQKAQQDAESFCGFFVGGQNDYPAVPPAVFTVDEVRSMKSFSGVYIAISEQTGAVQYVGKSCDVTKRVSKSRPELRGCKLAVIKMPEPEIHFAELYYISKCRPVCNKEGRLAVKEATDGR